jgi:hypothetical protein
MTLLQPDQTVMMSITHLKLQDKAGSTVISLTATQRYGKLTQDQILQPLKVLVLPA